MHKKLYRSYKPLKSNNNNILLFTIFCCICIIIIISISTLIYFYFYKKTIPNLVQSVTEQTKLIDDQIKTIPDLTITDQPITDQPITDPLTDQNNSVIDNTNQKIDQTNQETKQTNNNNNYTSDTPEQDKNSIAKILENPNLYAAGATSIAAEQIILLSISKSYRNYAKNIAIKAGLKAQRAVFTIAGKVLQALGAKAASKAAIKIASAIGTKLLTHGAVAASTGPAAPLVAAGLFAFDIVSITLDVADVGGYNKMATKEEYLKIKDEIFNKNKQAVELSGGIYPLICGPLTKLSDTEYTEAIEKIINEIMTKTPPDQLIEPFFTKMKNDIKNNILTITDLEDKVKMQTYYDLIDDDKLLAKATSLLCVSLGGKIINENGRTNECSYIDKETCDKSYSWPLKEDSTEIYTEFKSDLLGGVCVQSSSLFKTICEDNKIPYNADKGICDITENYCLRKGAKWMYNDKIKENDCMISAFQEFLEMLLGTTITRGRIQIFDPDQYESCKEDEIDNIYFCRSVSCPPDRTNRAGLCYLPCKDGYSESTAFSCVSNCPQGYNDTGPATCQKGGPVHSKVTYVQKKRPCNNDEDDDGTSCWSKNKWEPISCSWGGGCSGGWKAPYITKYVWDRAYCENNDRLVGGICYPDCPQGQQDDGATCREPISVIGRNSYILDSLPAVHTRVKQRKVDYSTKDN